MDSQTCSNLMIDINNILFQPMKVKDTNDFILGDMFYDELKYSAIIKNIQMRIGNLWEVIACKYFNWTKVSSGIDLIDINRKLAIELKNADNTDNSSSRARNCQKLLDFKQLHPEYRLLYVCINNRNTNESQSYFMENGIHFVSGEYALDILFGDMSTEVINILRSCVWNYKNVMLKNE